MQPLAPHKHRHVDISYLNLGGTFYYLCSLLDGYSRSIVHWENGPQFIAKDFKTFIRVCDMTHVRTCPIIRRAMGSSNAGTAASNGSIKRECLRPAAIESIKEARRKVADYVEHYNHSRLHSGLPNLLPFGIGTNAINLRGLRPRFS